MNWQFLDTGFHPGEFNMQFDESLVLALAHGEGHPTVRVYGWTPPAISLGWNQRMEEIDLEKTRKDGIGVVRRPTGGRAILHSEELTYSVTMPSTGKNISAVYSEISQALVRGLATLGANVSLEKSQPHFPTLYQSPSSAVCFSSSARYEIQIGGKKLIGSAQRRYVGTKTAEVVLQHGSLLLGRDHQRIVKYLKLKSEADRQKLTDEMEEKTIDLSSALNREVTFGEAADAVRTGFQEAWGIRFRDASHEPKTAGQLV